MYNWKLGLLISPSDKETLFNNISFSIMSKIYIVG